MIHYVELVLICLLLLLLQLLLLLLLLQFNPTGHVYRAGAFFSLYVDEFFSGGRLRSRPCSPTLLHQKQNWVKEVLAKDCSRKERKKNHINCTFSHYFNRGVSRRGFFPYFFIFFLHSPASNCVHTHTHHTTQRVCQKRKTIGSCPLLEMSDNKRESLSWIVRQHQANSCWVVSYSLDILYIPNHQWWYAKWKLSWNMYTHCIHVFARLALDLYAQSVLIDKISASELSRKFKSALLVG